MTSKPIRTEHKDLIQDIAFDFYGKRVATASLDQTVKIWSINEKNEWEFKEELKINPGLYKVAWAHPEFGSLIAVACDRVVWIYEETCYGTGKSTQSGWVKRTPALSDSRAPITDLKFAPKFLGLQLAICSQNGEVRIYECADILSSNAWSIVSPEIKTNMSSCSSCSWSTCFNLPILLAIGSDESNTNSDKLALFEFVESRSNIKIPHNIICTDPIRSLAFAPSIGKLFHVLAIASKQLLICTIKQTREQHKYQISTTSLDHDAWRVCWNTVGSVLASAGEDRKVRLWKYNYNGTWKLLYEIAGDSGMIISNDFNLTELLNREREKASANEQDQENNQNMLEMAHSNVRFPHSNNNSSNALVQSRTADWY